MAGARWHRRRAITQGVDDSDSTALSELDAPHAAEARFCPTCGFDLRRTLEEQGTWLERRWTFHGVLKTALALWAIAYPVISCAPLLATGTDTAGGTAVGGLASLVVGATLFGPWIVRLLVLGVLVWVSKG